MTPIRAKLDEVMRPGQSYSRRPRARALGVEVIATRRSDAVVCALCRRLVEAGHDPATPMEVYRGSTLALHVRSIGAAAKLTVEESGSGPKFRRWRPFEGPAEPGGVAAGASAEVEAAPPLPGIDSAKNQVLPAGCPEPGHNAPSLGPQIK